MAEERKVKRTEGDEIIDIMVEKIKIYLKQKKKTDTTSQKITSAPDGETCWISSCYPAFLFPVLTSQIGLKEYKEKILELFNKLIKDRELAGSSFEDIIEAILSMMPNKIVQDTIAIRNLIRGANSVFGNIESLKRTGRQKL